MLGTFALELSHLNIFYFRRFHILSDFDEDKRSCRRKLERHNNRRRRKTNDPKDGPEKESQQTIVSDDLSGDDDAGKGLTIIHQETTFFSSFDCFSFSSLKPRVICIL